MRRGLTYLFLGCAALAAPACSDATRGVRADRQAAGAPRPPDDAAAPRLRFTYRLTGQPAAGLVVSFADQGAAGGAAGGTADDAVRSPDAAAAARLPGAIALDADGSLPRPERDGALRLTDPVSGLVLFQAGSLDGLGDAGQPIRLPLPARITGRVGGFGGAPGDLDVHHGSGVRLSVTDYARREQGLLLVSSPEENRAWGLELPTISSRWEVTRPRPDGSFDTGWLPLVAAPQLIVADRAGHVATLEVAVPPSLGAHAQLDAGAIAPQPSAAIELDRAGLPATNLPLLLQVGIDRAEVAAASGGAAALRLALLHRLDARAAHFAMRRREVAVELEGVTKLGGLPPFSRLELHVTGPRPGIALRRTLTPSPAGTAAPAGTSRLSLRAAELLGTPRKIPLAGRVRFADGRPAAATTVVYSSYPDRQETRTDRTGAFKLPAVAAGREAVLFVDAPAGGQPPFERITVSQRLEIAPDQQRVDIAITVPLPLTAANVVRCPGGQAANVDDPIPYELRTCGAGFTQSEQLAYCPILAAYRHGGTAGEVIPVEVEEIQVDPKGGQAAARLRVPASGSYAFVLSYTPFVYAEKIMDIDSTEPVTVQLAPPDPWPSAILVAIDALKLPAPDLEIAFPNWVYGADPFNGLTNQQGNLEIKCFNMDPVDAFVASERGCFEGYVKLKGLGPYLPLGPCEGL